MPSTETKALEREVRINATPDTVFSYLVDRSKLRRWMSIGGAWDPQPGGSYRLEMTKEDIAVGTYVEVERPSRLVFTWGWEGDDAVTKPGASTVEITVRPDGTGCVVRLVHRDLSAESAEKHGHGWEHYLQRLSVAATGADPGPDPFQS